MTEEAKQLKREYYKKWRERNKEKTKGYQEAYWERMAKATDLEKSDTKQRA